MKWKWAIGFTGTYALFTRKRGGGREREKGKEEKREGGGREGSGGREC